MHRPFMDWGLVEGLAADPSSPQARIHAGTRAIMAARRGLPALAGWVPTRVIDAGSALLAYERAAEVDPVTCVLNFTEAPQAVAAGALGLPNGPLLDALSGAVLEGGTLRLPPYGALWLMPAG